MTHLQIIKIKIIRLVLFFQTTMISSIIFDYILQQRLKLVINLK